MDGEWRDPRQAEPSEVDGAPRKGLARDAAMSPTSLEGPGG